jgi:hypothetical protein
MLGQARVIACSKPQQVRHYGKTRNLKKASWLHGMNEFSKLTIGRTVVLIRVGVDKQRGIVAGHAGAKKTRTHKCQILVKPTF